MIQDLFINHEEDKIISFIYLNIRRNVINAQNLSLGNCLSRKVQFKQEKVVAYYPDGKVFT